MRELLPLSEISQEKRELIQAFVMSAADRSRLSDSIAETLTIDAMMEMSLEICKHVEFPDGFTALERMLWTSRSAYLLGFRQALDAYSQVFEEAMREDDSEE